MLIKTNNIFLTSVISYFYWRQSSHSHLGQVPWPHFAHGEKVNPLSSISWALSREKTTPLPSPLSPPPPHHWGDRIKSFSKSATPVSISHDILHTAQYRTTWRRLTVDCTSVDRWWWKSYLNIRENRYVWTGIRTAAGVNKWERGHEATRKQTFRSEDWDLENQTLDAWTTCSGSVPLLHTYIHFLLSFEVKVQL